MVKTHVLYIGQMREADPTQFFSLFTSLVHLSFKETLDEGSAALEGIKKNQGGGRVNQQLGAQWMSDLFPQVNRATIVYTR